MCTGDEPMTESTQMQVYVRHWRPSNCSVDKTTEIILDQNTPDHLRAKLSQLSGIPKEDIQYAKVGVVYSTNCVGVVIKDLFANLL